MGSEASGGEGLCGRRDLGRGRPTTRGFEGEGGWRREDPGASASLQGWRRLGFGGEDAGAREKTKGRGEGAREKIGSKGGFVE